MNQLNDLKSGTLAPKECTDSQECLDSGCQECCEHDFDPGEGFTCLNCGLQGEPSDVYDEDYGSDR